MRSFVLLGAVFASVASAACPAMGGQLDRRGEPNHAAAKREAVSGDDFLEQFEVDDTDVYMTSDVGGPIADQASLKAGERGPTLLEDFAFRQKITHFDHERVRAEIESER